LLRAENWANNGYTTICNHVLSVLIRLTPIFVFGLSAGRLSYALGMVLSPGLHLSSLDSKRFELVIERMVVTKNDTISDDEVVTLCINSKNDLIILRAPCQRVQLAHSLLSASVFEVIQADTLVYFSKDLTDANSNLSDSNEFEIRTTTILDSKQVQEVAGAAFKGYVSHYAANPIFSNSKIDEGYIEWALSCLESPSTTVLGAIDDGILVGFIAFRIEDRDAEIVLNAVHPRFQRRGAYRQLLSATSVELQKRDCKSISISTQISNHRVINSWIKFGFVLDQSFNTFHLRRR